MFLNLTLTPKVAQKDQKIAQKGPKKCKMWSNLRQKVRAVLPKPKLIVYIGRSQKNFRTRPQPEKKPFHFSIFISKFSNSEIPNSEFSNSEVLNSEVSNCKFQIANLQIPNFQIPHFRIPNFKL